MCAGTDDQFASVKGMGELMGAMKRYNAAAVAKFAELRGTYEPFVDALAQHFVLTLPPIVPEGAVVDNWQTSAWMKRTAGLNRLVYAPVFDGQVAF